MKADPAATVRPPRAMIAGFFYWLLFVLALEPGNIIATGGRLSAATEILRILGASLIGACMAPLVLAVVRRYPLDGPAGLRAAAIQIAGCLAIAAGGVAVSCLLADWFLASEHRELLLALRQEMEGNGPLVAFSTIGFAVLAHTRIFRRIANDAPAERAAYLNYLTVKTRGADTRIDLASVDWIESQGNYLALHCGPRTHLVRMGLGALESKLDPQRFARIHRRILVAMDRVQEVASLGAGDARLKLADGTPLRLSRTYRAGFLAARAGLETGEKHSPSGSLEVAPFRS